MAGVDSERYWDDRARENALFYVDSELDYDSPDVEEFWRRGDDVVDGMLDAVGMSLGPDETVVDIGCGVGRITRALAARTGRVYGLDVSSEMLALARQHNPDATNIEWLHGDGNGLGVLDDGTVDGCFSFVVFQHIPDPAITLRYIREMGRVLRPGGWALFQVSTDPTVHRHPKALRARLKAFLLRDRQGDAERAWWGSAVAVPALERAAADGNLTIERLLGVGSQYTTVLTRRMPD